ncbi:MAG: hypothetical protein ACRDX8_09635 [Acidimicrobiales bacterium]
MLSKTEMVWRHLLVGAYEWGHRRYASITEVAEELEMGLSTVHQALSRPVGMGAVVVGGTGLRVLDPARLCLVFAARRELAKDMVAEHHLAMDAASVEAALADTDAILGGFGAGLAHLGANTIASYDTVIAYCAPGQRLALPQAPVEAGVPGARGPMTRLIVAEADPMLGLYADGLAVTPLAQTYADLFNLPGWQATRFTAALGAKMAERDR